MAPTRRRCSARTCYCLSGGFLALALLPLVGLALLPSYLHPMYYDNSWFQEVLSLPDPGFPPGISASLGDAPGVMNLSNITDTPLYVLGTQYPSAFCHGQSIPASTPPPPSDAEAPPEGLVTLHKLVSGRVFEWAPTPDSTGGQCVWAWRPQSSPAPDALFIFAGRRCLHTVAGNVSCFPHLNRRSDDRPPDAVPPESHTANITLLFGYRTITLPVVVSYRLNPTYEPVPPSTYTLLSLNDLLCTLALFSPIIALASVILLVTGRYRQLHPKVNPEPCEEPTPRSGGPAA
jgi:hypothetical protein